MELNGTTSKSRFKSFEKRFRKESYVCDKRNFSSAMSTLKSELFRLAPSETGETFKKTSVKRQWISVLTMDLLAFSYGAVCGWPSASIPLLKSDDTPLESGPISSHDASWIASGMCIGGLFGNLLIGWVSDSIRLTIITDLHHFKAFNENRTKGLALHCRFSANSRLASHLLRNKSHLSDCVTHHSRICWRRTLLHHPNLHFGDFRWSCARNFRLNLSVFLQSGLVLCLCVRRVRRLLDCSVGYDSSYDSFSRLLLENSRLTNISSEEKSPWSMKPLKMTIIKFWIHLTGSGKVLAVL